MTRFTILVSIVFLVIIIITVCQVEGCNEAVCGSVVSKCLLTKSCDCDLENCTSCKDCFNCLSYLYTECCSCVDMCPKPNDTSPVLRTLSHVEDFQESIPALFSVLTESPDSLNRWNIETFPLHIEHGQYAYKEMKVRMLSAEQEVVPTKHHVISLNCTVAFWSQCMSWTKCKNNCQSMGASSYRWFHDGCCECIGQYCINYGINESRCSACSRDEGGYQDPDDGVMMDEDYAYGEEDD